MSSGEPARTWLMPRVGRKIIAMANPPKTSSISFGRTNTEPAQDPRIKSQGRKAALTGQDLRTTVGQHAR